MPISNTSQLTTEQQKNTAYAAVAREPMSYRGWLGAVQQPAQYKYQRPVKGHGIYDEHDNVAVRSIQH